jgi:peptidyl-prolyl cis-trans isomerase C
MARWSQAAAVLAAGVPLVGIALAQGAPAAAPKAATRAPAVAVTGRVAPAPGASDADVKRRAQAVARYQGGDVTIGELEEAIRQQSPYLRRRYSDPQVLAELLAKTVRFELLANEAERRGYATNPQVHETTKQNAVQRLMKADVDEQITIEQIPADDVKAYYQANLAEFVRPALRRANHVMFTTLEDAKAALAEAKEMDMRGFRELARQKSIDEQSNARGGDLGYFDAQGKPRDDGVSPVPEAIAKAAFALQTVGDVVGEPVKIPGGFSLVKLTGQRPASSRTLADADATIRARLWRDKRQTASDAFVQKLREEFKPVVHAELLGQIDLADAPGASAVPGEPPSETPPP